MRWLRQIVVGNCWFILCLRAYSVLGIAAKSGDDGGRIE